MQYRIEGGSLPAVRINLNPGETMISEAGGRTWSRGAVDSTVTTLGGAGKALGRMLMGESLFMNLYTAQEPAEIAFSSSFPGRIVARELGPGQSIICQKHAFLCATYGVQLAMHFQKKLGAGLVGGEGFIMQKVTGPGLVFLEVDGYCQDYDLAPGERLVCDTGVLAVMDETCSMDVRKWSCSGVRFHTRICLPRRLANLYTCVCRMTLTLSIRNTPQRIGKSNSLWIITAHTPMMPPIVRLPVSPMKICAGKPFHQRKPISAPTNAARNTTSSSLPGMYITSK